MNAKYVILEGPNHNKFFGPYTTDKDATKGPNGPNTYKILGYANSVEEAQTKLYGKIDRLTGDKNEHN